jgi:signal transduction histidine kinase
MTAWIIGAACMGAFGIGVWLTLRFVQADLARLLSLLTETEGVTAQRRFYTRWRVLHPLATAVNEMLRRLQEAQIRERQELEQRRLFLTSIAHDLRTPLSSVLGYVEAVHKGLVAEADEARYLETAHVKGQALAHTLNQFFEWARLEQQHIQIEPVALNVAERTREVLIEFWPTFEARDIRCDLDLPSRAVSFVDPTSVDRVLRNLLQNVLDHAVGVTVIRVRMELAGDRWSLWIEDDGHVSDEWDSETMFLPFRQRKGSQGAGLGLAIARQLLRLQQSELQAERSPLGGLRMHIELPSGVAL